jgi:succinyl-diaminopimelate desuccinylase
MKAGDAVMLALLEDLGWESSWAEPTFVFYEREEGPYSENGLETSSRNARGSWTRSWPSS